jgi:hypothetical protein
VQLQHVASGKFVSFVPRERAEHERQHVRVALEEHGHEGCWMQIAPAYRSRQVGQPVRLDSPVRWYPELS